MIKGDYHFRPDYAERANEEVLAFFRAKIPRHLKMQNFILSTLSSASHSTPWQAATQEIFSSSVETYLEEGFSKKIQTLYSPQELSFIEKQCAAFERVHLGFVYFSLLSPNQRSFAALEIAKIQYRTGWQRIGVPTGFNQTITDHMQSAERLARMIFKADPEIETLCSVLAHHDYGEAVIGDFTPVDPIAKPDKKKIELLGLRLITHTAAKYGNRLAQTIEDGCMLYEGTDPAFNQIRTKATDIDLLEMLCEAPLIAHTCPEASRSKIIEGLQQFWDYVGEKIKTPEAHKFYDGLVPYRKEYIMRPAEILALALNL